MRKSIFVVGWFLIWLILGQQGETKEIATLSELETKEVVYLPELDAQYAVTVEDAEPDYFEFLAKCVEAEAGNQDMVGRRLVVDVILNRVDSPRFPNDVWSVITQKDQFSTYPYAISRANPSEETYEAVRLELEDRIDTEILFFTAGDYNRYCIPAYQHGDHYFGY